MDFVLDFKELGIFCFNTEYDVYSKIFLFCFSFHFCFLNILHQVIEAPVQS